MAAPNSGGFNVTKDLTTERRENSYEKPLPSAPDIQQPGKAGDVGNGPATGRTKPPATESPSSCEKRESVIGEGSCPRGRPNVSEVTPDDGAEPSNPYSGA